MLHDREDYIPPVGEAREPSIDRRRIIARLFTLAFIGFIIWLGWTHVIHTDTSVRF